MILQHLKKWALLYAVFIILLKGLADIYYFRASASFYYALISTLFLLALMLILILFKPRSHTQISVQTKGNKFLANLSHEFRTPLIGIIGAADLLENENLTSAQFNHLNIIKKAGYNLLSIIDNILDLHRLEQGQIDINLTNCSLKSLINASVFEVSAALKTKGLNINIDLDEGDNVILCLDEAKYKQIVLILLHKAIDNSEKGTIYLQTSLKKNADSHGLLSLSITYQGIFAQAPAANPMHELNNYTPDYEFTGCLGLYLCRQLIEYLGGRLFTVRQAEQSIVFQLTLPVEIVAAADNHHQEEDFKNVTPNYFKRIKVLLVEDNPINIKILSEMLNNYGFEATTAENGLKCLQVLQDNTFDVILMDMQMPVMDGYEASRLIRNDPDLGLIPIIAVTANAMIGDREKCLAAGCTAYLAKPFLARELVQEIENVMQGKIVLKKAADSSSNHDYSVAYNQEFIHKLGNSIQALEDAYADNDWESIEHLCLEIKSLAGMHTYKDIYHQVSLLEAAAHKKMARIVKLSIIDLKKYSTSLKKAADKTDTGLS